MPDLSKFCGICKHAKSVEGKHHTIRCSNEKSPYYNKTLGEQGELPEKICVCIMFEDYK